VIERTERQIGSFENQDPVRANDRVVRLGRRHRLDTSGACNESTDHAIGLHVVDPSEDKEVVPTGVRSLTAD